MDFSMSSVQPPRLFISHSHADNAFGVRLAEDLRRALGNDQSVWYDVSGGLHGGDAWWRKIVQEIATRPIFVVVLSPDAMESRWVNDEIDLAWNLKNTPDGKTIIPVLYRACQPRADLLTRHIISFLPPREYDAALAETLAALGVTETRVAGASPAAPTLTPPAHAVGATAVGRAAPDLAQQLLPQIEAAYQKRDWAEVARKAEFLIRRAPDQVTVPVYRMLGVALLEEDAALRAREVIDTALALDALDLDSLRAAARVALTLGDADGAHVLLDDALALASDDTLRLLLLDDDAYTLRLAGKSAEEVRRCEEALRLAHGSLHWRARKVVALTLAGRFAETQAEMEHLARETTAGVRPDSTPHAGVKAHVLHAELTRELRAFGQARSATERQAIAERFAALLTRNAPAEPLRDDPLSLQRQYAPRLPERLAALGYIMRPVGAVDVIIPPLIDLPAGPCLLSDGTRWQPETPPADLPHRWVDLAAYQLARYPVTVAEYACFTRATGREPQRSETLDWQAQLARPEHPVVCVTWHDALAYAAWLSDVTGQRWRLPTEAEWEKAARWDAESQKSRSFPWGATFDPTRCNCANVIGATTAVGTYPTGASPCGALDLAGNVWEWTSNLAGDSAVEASPEDSPTEIAMLRGGSWFSAPAEVSGVARRAALPYGYTPAIGFRLVRIPGR